MSPYKNRALLQKRHSNVGSLFIVAAAYRNISLNCWVSFGKRAGFWLSYFANETQQFREIFIVAAAYRNISLNCWVFFAKEPYLCRALLQMRPSSESAMRWLTFVRLLKYVTHAHTTSVIHIVYTHRYACIHIMCVYD